MRIDYGKQKIFPKDILSTKNILNQKFLTQGKNVNLFEKKIQSFLKVKHAIVCNSGTSAIHLALSAIELKKNDIVLMPAINFIAAYNMSLSLGAKIYLVDVHPITGQMTPENLLKVIKENRLKKIKAIITMYLGGAPENILSFYMIKKKLKCFLIEDSCHAFGSSYKVNENIYNVGSCKHSDISTFSFHPLKTITTGEGGAVTTNNSKIATKILLLRSHGLFRKNQKKYWDYQAKSIGFNYRLSDINCALGISQMDNVQKIIKKRNKVVKLYQKKLLRLEKFISLPLYSKNIYSCCHLMIVFINFDKLKSNKEIFFKYMNMNLIFPQQHYIPIFNVCKKKIDKKKFINTLKFFKNSVSLPIFFSITNKQIDRVVNSIEKFIKINLKKNEKLF
jgi:dTDP-4-amino-4,6-dideoxygalactose transaminase